MLREVPHRWLLTYDDSPFIRDLYAEYTQVRWTLQYGLNNYKQPTAHPSEELFVANYPIQSKHSAQLCLVFERCEIVLLGAR